MDGQLEKVFSKVLGIGEGELVDNASPRNVAKWDSLRHVQLVMAMERSFGISFSNAEIVSLTSVGAIKDVLRGKGVSV